VRNSLVNHETVPPFSSRYILRRRQWPVNERKRRDGQVPGAPLLALFEKWPSEPADTVGFRRTLRVRQFQSSRNLKRINRVSFRK
jgi:hypothetical protein